MASTGASKNYKRTGTSLGASPVMGQQLGAEGDRPVRGRAPRCVPCCALRPLTLPLPPRPRMVITRRIAQ